MIEKWRDIPDYKGLYQVSSLGAVKSKTKNALKPYTHRDGHLLVVLSKNGTTKTFSVHRLVLFAFIGNCPGGYQACHNDGNPANNKLNNLRWDSNRNNQLDRRRHGKSGREVQRNDGVKFVNATLAAETMGCDPSDIHKVCKNQRHTCAGFKWNYV